MKTKLHEYLAKPTGIAVGISSSPNAERLLEWTARMAAELHVEWHAFHIDGGTPLGGADERRLEANLKYAQKLGAQVSTYAGADVVSTLIEAALRNGVTMLVLGRSGLSRFGILPKKSSISDRILREANGLDIVVVSDFSEARLAFNLASILNLFSVPWRQYLLMVTVFLLVTIFCLISMPVIGNRGVELLYLAAILLLSLISRPAPIVMLAVISSLAFNFFFIPPRFTFAIASVEDILVFALYLLVAAVTGFFSSGLRSREALLRKRDRVASLLLSAGEQFSKTQSEATAASTTAMLVERYTGSPAVVCIKGDSRQSDSFSIRGKDRLEAADILAAKSCIEQGTSCGAGSASCIDASFRFVPARASDRVVASIGYIPNTKKNRQSEDDELFQALGKSLALNLDKVRSEELSRRATLELESERLAKVLFDSVSHELRTPLTTITGSLSALKDDEIGGNPAARSELLDGALASACRLNDLVEDFLSISRMESGRLRLKLEPIEAAYIASAIASAVKPSLAGRPLSVSLPKEQGELMLDATLVIRMGINLVENACRYSRKGGGIELAMSTENGGLRFIVRDLGPGFSEERMQAPFIKFRKAKGDQPGSLGLGLAMCKGIVDAHGGRIEARHCGDCFEVEAFFPGCMTWEAE
jgi:two-component system sensor histidine kinase KdpD